MKKYGKIAVALSLSAALAGTSVAAGVYAAETENTETEQLTEAAEQNAETEQLTEAAERNAETEQLTEAAEQNAETEQLTEAAEQNAEGDAEAEITKDEMVYVLAGADGSAQKIIVSDWLQNGSGSETISDRSELGDIENVKGDESFTAGEDNALVWDAQGNDIYYQGTTDKELPVEVAISYKLDGADISPEELAGKSGKLTIRFDYTNRQCEDVEIDGQKEKIYVPFAMLTGVLFDDDTLTNVEVTNGKLFGDGAHTVVVGAAFPGLQEDLQISEEEFEIPDYVEITGDAENFEPGLSVTLATNELVNGLVSGLGTEDADLEGTLKESVGELLGAMDQLESGAGSLAAGAGDLDVGAASLQEGMTQLNDGLSELSASNDSLNEGAKKVFETLLSTANGQIAASGLDVPELTIENYARVLDGVIVTLNTDVALGQALGSVMGAGEEQADAAETQTETAKRQTKADGKAEAAGENDAQANLTEMQEKLAEAQAGIESLTELKASLDSYNEFYLGLQSYTAGVAKSAAGAGELKTGTDDLKEGADQLSAGAAQLYDGILTLTGGEKPQGGEQTEDAAGTDASSADESETGLRELIESISTNFGGLTARLRAVKEVSENYRSFAGIDESMGGQVKFLFRMDSASLS